MLSLHLIIFLFFYFDMQAILAADCLDFVEKVKNWFQPLAPCVDMTWWRHIVRCEREAEAVDEDLFGCIQSVRDMIEIMNLPEEDF